MTILFTDLVGSTALAQRVGDTAADDLRRAHFELLRRAVASTSGSEVKTIGDAMMVSYTSAADAIAGAVAMQQRVHAHNATDPAPRIDMRVGLSAGDATYEDGDWFGTPVVEASRLCSAAGGGQILVSDIVRILAGSRTDHPLTPVPPVEAKGLAEPIAACEVGWAPLEQTAAGRLSLPLPPQVEHGDAFAFVGRDEQLEALVGAWKTSVADGRLSVFIGGEPGIGKTRLVKELCRSTHTEGAAVLWGSCDEELGGPYQPFAEALGWLADATAQGQLAELLGPAGAELLPIVPQLQQLVPGLGTRLLDDAESERNRLFEAATRLLSNLSERQPVVLVLDDLHWARKPTLLLLRHLLKTTIPLRLLVLATYRDTDLDRTHPLAEMLADLRRQNGVERLALHGLDEHGVRLFLQRAAGHDLDEQGMRLVAAVHAETEGNPFFIGEVLRHLSESGALVFRDGRWTSDRQLGEVGIPEGIREVIGRRLSHLDPAANEVLTRAAVIGREFDLRLLAELSEGTTDDVLDTLAAAERSGLVEAVTGRPGCYRFSHALVRSTLYDELPTSRRLRLHQAIGTAIEGRGDPERHLTELARHFTEAAALGAVAKAADYCRRAGDQARADLAFEEAAVQYQRGLEVLDLADANDPELEARRGDLLVAAGDVLNLIADPRAIDFLRAAERLGRSTDDLTLLARVVLARNNDVFNRDGADVAADIVSLGEHVLARADELPEALHARVLSAICLELFWVGEPERRRELSDRSLEVARRVGDRRLLADVLRGRSMIYDLAEPDALAQIGIECTEMIEAAQGLDDVLLCTGFLGRVPTRVLVGDVAAGDADLAEGERLADRLNVPGLVLRAKVLRAAGALLAGRLDECEALVADFESYAMRENVPAGSSAGASIRYRLGYERGQLADLEDLLVAVIAAQPGVPVWRMGLCGVYLQTDRHELARPHVEAVAADDFAMVPRNALFLLTCSSVARVASQVGALEAAELAYGHAAAFDHQLAWSGASYEYPIGVGVGAAAAALGRFDDAERHFAASLELCERAGAPSYHAATQIHWAEALAMRGAAGDGARAREMADAALATAEELGLAYVAKRARRLIHAS